jgi:hypothetical protein
MGPFRDGWVEADVEAVIDRNDPDELAFAPIVVSMCPPDYEWALSVCLRLASHPHSQVRANAILGFGHLARTCNRLDKSVVKPLVERALKDDAREVRSHARSAADDIESHLGWVIDRG